jgi:cupin 2 domain-containing protein
MDVQNLFERLPSDSRDEIIQTLEKSRNVRIERIVSHGHASPDGFWYDQSEQEFVVLLRGAARLRFAEDERAIELRPGD